MWRRKKVLVKNKKTTSNLHLVSFSLHSLDNFDHSVFVVSELVDILLFTSEFVPFQLPLAVREANPLPTMLKTARETPVYNESHWTKICFHISKCHLASFPGIKMSINILRNIYDRAIHSHARSSLNVTNRIQFMSKQ